MSKKKDKFDWLEFDSGTFVETPDRPVYGTPDWVRHPERYPELMERMKEWGKKWNEGLKK